MTMTKRYSTFAYISLILATVYAVLSIPALIVGNYHIYHDMDIMSFAARYAGNTALGLSIIVFNIILSVAMSVIWLMWIGFIVTGKESIRIPAIVTFSYYVANLIFDTINGFINYEGLFELIKGRLYTFLLMAAWLVLVIKTDETHRKVFAVIRSLIFVLSFISSSFFYIRLISNRIEFGRPLYGYDYIGIADTYFRYFIIALFIIWIFNPKVFLRSSHEEAI